MGYVDQYCCNDMLHCSSNCLYHIVVFHCIVWLLLCYSLCFVFTNTLASGVLIYPVTDMGAYKLISFLPHYVYVFVFSLRLWNKTFVILSYIYQMKALQKQFLVHEWRKSILRVRSYCKICDPISPKSIIVIESRCLSMTGRNFLFHHCTLARNAIMDKQNITNGDQSLGTCFST